MKKIVIKTDFIKLGSLLKMIDIISTGGEAKFYLMENVVYINNIIDNRRGRKIYPKDIVKIKDREYVISND